jgi:hypothetical protein
MEKYRLAIVVVVLVVAGVSWRCRGQHCLDLRAPWPWWPWTGEEGREQGGEGMWRWLWGVGEEARLARVFIAPTLGFAEGWSVPGMTAIHSVRATGTHGVHPMDGQVGWAEASRKEGRF